MGLDHCMSSSYQTEPARIIMSAKSQAQKLIEEHDVAIFSKTYCPYCTKAKNIVSGLGLPEGSVGILELDEMGEEGAAIQDYLASETGQRTVPSVWIKKDFIGGSSDLAKLSKSDLEKKVWKGPGGQRDRVRKERKKGPHKGK